MTERLNTIRVIGNTQIGLAFFEGAEFKYFKTSPSWGIEPVCPLCLLICPCAWVSLVWDWGSSTPETWPQGQKGIAAQASGVFQGWCDRFLCNKGSPFVLAAHRVLFSPVNWGPSSQALLCHTPMAIGSPTPVVFSLSAAHSHQNSGVV